MHSNRLQLNTTKTEILWSTTGRRFHQLPQSTLRVGADHVAPAPVVRDLGIYLDSDVSMRSHVVKRPFLPASQCYVNIGLRSVRRSLYRICSPVVDVVTRSVTTGLRQYNPGWHSILPSPAAPVGHELGRATCVLLVDVRPHHSAPPPTALAESTGEDSVQACCSRVQVFARNSTVV